MSEKNSEKKNLRKAHISEKRMKRFTWEAGDLKFFSSKEEFEENLEGGEEENKLMGDESLTADELDILEYVPDEAIEGKLKRSAGFMKLSNAREELHVGRLKFRTTTPKELKARNQRQARFFLRETAQLKTKLKNILKKISVTI